MGLTYVTVKLSAPAGSRRSYSASFLVDTGATEHREWILSSSRNNHEPQERFDGVGFRVVLVP